MGKGVKTVEAFGQSEGEGERYHQEAEGTWHCPSLIVLPGTNRSITLKYQRRAAAPRRQLHVIYERAHMIYEDLKKHQHTADFL